MSENIGVALLTMLLLFIGLFTDYVEMVNDMFIHEFSILVVILNGIRLIKNHQKVDSHQFSDKEKDLTLNM